MRETPGVAKGFRTGAGYLLIVMMAGGCLSSTAASSAGSGGAGDPGGMGGGAGSVSSTGGMPIDTGAGGYHVDSTATGSCTTTDSPSPACDPPDPAEPPPCTRDCCYTCGIDAAGFKLCRCDVATGKLSCACSPPPGFPAGLSGGNCSPQGYAATMPPAAAPAGSVSLKGVACTKTNAVCFTAENTASSQRGCICMADGIMHCGSVNGWFTFSGGDTTYN